jgi:hypothetical protein
MGKIKRKKSGNIFNGSKLNVEGQGISTVKKQPQDKIIIKDNKTDTNT